MGPSTKTGPADLDDMKLRAKISGPLALAPIEHPPHPPNNVERTKHRVFMAPARTWRPAGVGPARAAAPLMRLAPLALLVPASFSSLLNIVRGGWGGPGSGLCGRTHAAGKSPQRRRAILECALRGFSEGCTLSRQHCEGGRGRPN